MNSLEYVLAWVQPTSLWIISPSTPFWRVFSSIVWDYFHRSVQGLILLVLRQVFYCVQVGSITKKASEDTSLTTINTETKESINVPIPKDSIIIIYTNGIHYNRASYVTKCYIRRKLIYFRTVAARYWDDPHEFKPKRFLQDWPRDAFVPFSTGKW